MTEANMKKWKIVCQWQWLLWRNKIMLLNYRQENKWRITRITIIQKRIKEIKHLFFQENEWLPNVQYAKAMKWWTPKDQINVMIINDNTIKENVTNEEVKNDITIMTDNFTNEEVRFKCYYLLECVW